LNKILPSRLSKVNESDTEFFGLQVITFSDSTV